jgi:soluble lytic murein transglycosylase-like protein
LNRKAAIAAFALELALFSAGCAWAAPNGGASSAAAPTSNDEAMSVKLTRLGAAMARVIPNEGAPATTPAPTISTAPQDKRCKDGALAPTVVRKMVADEAARQNVDLKLADTIAGQESSFGALVNSPAAAAADAMGVMQLIAETAAHYDVADRCDVAENVRGGVSLIRDLSAQFGGNVFLILAAYNAGERRVIAAKGVPANSETVRYVAAGANAYYDFAGVLRANRRPVSDGAGAPVADPSTIPTDSVGQKWIGGSVLYVEQEK